MAAGGGTEYTFYFAWVPKGAPWDISLARLDEPVYDLLIEHDEGQIPMATVEIKNPYVGLINPAREYWAWLSYSYDACGPLPLFYGRLVGIPKDTLHNTIKLQLIARAPDYVYQKQQVARSLKVLPNYDPLFFEVSKRDDPDAILEGWSALYHVDRIDNRVSASDVLVGEDGTIVFAARDVFFDSVNWRLLQSPLKAINVKLEVQWQQQYRGSFFVGQWAWPTLGSDQFVGDWPKSGSNLGGGWYAGVSWAGERDPSLEQQLLLQQKPQVTSISYQWTNTEKEHQTGDTMSVSLNYTPPWGQTIKLKEINVIGLIDPNALDGFGDPAPINRPAKQDIDWFCYKTFALDFLGKQSLAVLSMVYMADRQRSERAETTVRAGVQPTLFDPTVVEDTEQITLKSGNLSVPQLEFLNWDTVGMGGHVDVGTIIFPDNPLVPGQTSSQVALNSGNTGMVIPTFSNIAGHTTQDGTVTWVSLGDTPPADGVQDWVRLGHVPLGAIILPKPVSGVPDFNSIQIPGQLNYPPTGTAVPIYSIFCSYNGGPGELMHECTSSGLLGGIGQGEHATFRTFYNPSGQYLYIAIQTGVSGEFHTTFNQTVGSQTVDGGVIWQNIGLAEVPIGGWPGMTPASTFFSTDRGKKSLIHGFCRARAKLRKRARAGEITFDTRFEVAAQLSCRMNGQVSDRRIPGGAASGKVVSYKLSANGDSGVVKGSVVLGASVGTSLGSGDFNFSEARIPSYVKEGYVKPGYQKYYSVRTLLSPGDPNWRPPGWNPQDGISFLATPTPPNWPATPPTIPVGCPPLNSPWEPGPFDTMGNEMGYTPPTAAPNDDGLTFPVNPSDVILKQGWHGLASTINPLNLQIYQLELDQIVHDAVAAANQTKYVNFSAIGGQASGTITVPVSPFYDIQIAVEIAVLQKMLQGTGLWFELVLKPVTNGPFSNYYAVETTDMMIRETVNLSAPAMV